MHIEASRSAHWASWMFDFLHASVHDSWLTDSCMHKHRQMFLMYISSWAGQHISMFGEQDPISLGGITSWLDPTSSQQTRTESMRNLTTWTGNHKQIPIQPSTVRTAGGQARARAAPQKEHRKTQIPDFVFLVPATIWTKCGNRVCWCLTSFLRFSKDNAESS